MERVTLLMKADAHGVMDQLEERSLLLKQNLREAELELIRKRARFEAMEDEARRLSDETSVGELQIAALDRDVELALSEGEEELARFAVRRLLPRRETLRAMTVRLAELEQSRERLRETLEAQESEFDELRRRVRARLAEDREAERTEIGHRGASPVVADEEIELELLRRRTLRGASDAGVRTAKEDA